MGMRWDHFVDHIKDLGYEGEPDDFDAVTLWLKRNGRAAETCVDHNTKETLELRKLYEERPGKPLDVSEIAEKARQEEMIDAAVKEKLEETEQRLTRNFGKDLEKFRPRERGSNAKGHDYATDIKVGADKLAEHPHGGFAHSGLYLKAVAVACSEGGATDERLTAYQKAALGSTTVSQEAVGADGGFAAPPDIRTAIESQITAETSVLGMTRQIPITGTGLVIPVDPTTQWGSDGVQANPTGETGTITQTKVKLEMLELRARKTGILIPVTEELLEDAPALSTYVTTTAGEKMDFKLGEYIFRGTGGDQPLGFIGAPGTVSVAKETSQVAATILGINVLKMWQRMYAPFRQNAVWFVNQDAETELYRMTIAGRAGQGSDETTSFGAFLYVPSGGLSQSPFATLMGRPVMPTQHCSQLGTVGDLCLVNLQRYITVTRGGLNAQTSIHLWFDQDAVAFKFTFRMDGQPWARTTISPRAGSNTMSATVTLATRG